MSELTELIDLGDSRIQSDQTQFLKFEQGRTYRLAIVSRKIARAFCHTFKEMGDGRRVNVLDSGTGSYAQQLWGEPDDRFAAHVYVYDTNKQGQLSKDALENCTGELMVWRITKAKYLKLSSLAVEMPLMSTEFTDPQYDLKITCTDMSFLKLDITGLPTCHWKTKREFFDQIRSRVIPLEGKLKSAIGQAFTDSELKAAMEGVDV